MLREFGLENAEVRSVWGKYANVQPIEKIKEARALMDEHRVKTSMLSTSFFKVPIPAEGSAALDQQWKLLDDAFDRADILGTKRLRTFAFTYKSSETPDPAVYPRIYELVRESAKRASKRGFKLAVENVGGSYVWTGADSAKLLAAVKEDSLVLNWDPNNAAEKGEKPFPDGFKLVDPARIAHVHLRDYRHNKDGKVEWCAVGEGEMDNLGQIRALLKTGYKGGWTLETHWRPPQGKAYATRTSLTALLKVVESA
jgi:sugar phosphate isomerase/epimerase